MFQLDTVSVLAFASAIVGVEKVVSWIWKYFNKAYKLKHNQDDREKTIEELKASNQAIIAGLRALLKNDLKNQHHEFIERKSITSEELDNFNTMYDSYAGLNGNGTCTKYKDELLALPIID